MIQVSIRCYRLVDEPPEKPYYVYVIETLLAGKYYSVERRYSEFLRLHKELRKHYSTPEFPPKRVRSSHSKVLQRRQQSLERYLRAMLAADQSSRLQVLTFLGVPQEEQFGSSDNIRDKSIDHQPVFYFKADPFLEHVGDDVSSDIIIQGVFQALYGKKE